MVSRRRYFGWKTEAVRADLETILASQDLLGLKVNMSKCEFTVLGSDPERVEAIRESFGADYPGARFVPSDDFSLLGTPMFREAL